MIVESVSDPLPPPPIENRKREEEPERTPQEPFNTQLLEQLKRVREQLKI